MNIFGKLFGTEKVVNNVFDKDNGLLTQVGAWVGNQQLTDQERLEFSNELSKDVRSFAIATMGESTDRSQTRRKLAIEWFMMHIFFIRLNVFCVLIDWLLIKYTEATSYELTTTLAGIVFDPWLCGITGGIGLFFWGTHSLRSSKFGKDS